MNKERHVNQTEDIIRIDVGVGCDEIDSLIRKATGPIDALVVQAEDLKIAVGQLAAKGLLETPDETR